MHRAAYVNDDDDDEAFQHRPPGGDAARREVQQRAMAGRPPIEDLKKAVVELVPDGVGTAAIAQEFGCSQRRVQQIVKAVGLARLVEPVHPHLDDVVCEEACRHGDNYGVAMLLGALRAHHPGWSFPRRRVLAALKANRPEALAARRHWAHRRIGRGVYVAHHFAYSWHMDLACKLQEYGIYVGALIDGDSRKALRLVALVDKLPVTIYDKLFAPAADRYGLPDQLITDKGSEWCVAAFACLLLAGLAGRSAASRRAHRFVPSKRNVRCSHPPSSTCGDVRKRCSCLRASSTRAMADPRRAIQLRDQHARARARPAAHQRARESRPAR